MDDPQIRLRWWERFFWPVESGEWLAVFRIGFGLQVIGYCLSLRNDWSDVLGVGQSSALNSRALSEALLSLESSIIPRVGWFAFLGEKLGLEEATVLWAVWVALLIAGLGLLAGAFSRNSAILAWFLHLAACKSADLVSYGVDNFMTIGLFYLMISPLPDEFSFDARVRRVPLKNPRWLGFFRRVLQLHLCAIYFLSGLTKCLGSGWWDGSNLWRIFIRPPFNTFSPEFLIKWKVLFPICGIAICLLETAYPFFIWRGKVGRVWLAGICLMHLVIGLAMHMYLFAMVMIVLNLAAFGPRGEIVAASPSPDRSFPQDTAAEH